MLLNLCVFRVSRFEMMAFGYGAGLVQQDGGELVRGRAAPTQAIRQVMEEQVYSLIT